MSPQTDNNVTETRKTRSNIMTTNIATVSANPVRILTPSEQKHQDTLRDAFVEIRETGTLVEIVRNDGARCFAQVAGYEGTRGRTGSCTVEFVTISGELVKYNWRNDAPLLKSVKIAQLHAIVSALRAAQKPAETPAVVTEEVAPAAKPAAPKGRKARIAAEEREARKAAAETAVSTESLPIVDTLVLAATPAVEIVETALPAEVPATPVAEVSAADAFAQLSAELG